MKLILSFRWRLLMFFFAAFLAAQAASALGKDSLGVDVLRQSRFSALQNRNVALITNHTGLDSRGVSTALLLKNAPGVHLRCVMSPEHGFHGTEKDGQKIKDSIDTTLGVPIYSLYGETTRPTDTMLKGVDTIVFDMQDIGTRFYTYIATMGQALEEAAKRHMHFVVLDRPNPIRGDIVEGDILDPDIKIMTGYFPIPVRHGLTVGELALWMNQAQNLKADVQVVRLRGWNRDDWFDETRLAFIPPSPNIPNLVSAILYPGIGCFEATNVSVGRGTSMPFQVFGAPWINGKALCAHLRQFNLPGFVFEPVTFVPEKDLYQGQTCQGVRILVTDRDKARPFRAFVRAFLFLQKNYPGSFSPRWDEVRVVTGSNWLRDAAEGRVTYEDLMGHYDKMETEFKNQIKAFYLYD